MQPPALSQRARNALKLKWTLPDETGGEPILHYVLEMSPQPLEWKQDPNTEVREEGAGRVGCRLQ